MERSHSTVCSRRAGHATATLASLFAVGAEAQDAPAGGGLPEVVVTARLREESMQRVPEAISAVSSQQTEQMFQATTQAVEGLAPNLVFDRMGAGPGAASISIRGLSFQDVEKSFDPAVGVALDGVALGTNTGAMLQIFDVDRMEVLRGPQGTLFGKNTIGGIINVIRPEPTGELGTRLRIGGGSHASRNFAGVVNLPEVGDQFAIKLFYTNRRQDGFDRNLHLGGARVGGMDTESYGAKLKWTPTQQLKLVYTYEREDDNSPIPGLLNVSLPTDVLCAVFQHCSLDGQGVVPETGDPHVVNQNGSDEQFYRVDGHTLAVNWQLATGLALDYTFGHRDSDEQTDQDFDATALTFFQTRRTQAYHQNSHELRLNYDDDRVNLVSGLYFWDSGYRLHQDTHGLYDILGLGTMLLPTATGPFVRLQEAAHNIESWAVFAQTDIRVAQDWFLTLGGRYTSESKWLQNRALLQATGSGDSISFFDTFPDRPSATWSKFTPKVGIRWDLKSTQMVYLSYSTGFRSGGFNGRGGTAASSSTPYGPETVGSIEFGYKSQWRDEHLRFNANVFSSRYEDKQEEVIVPVAGGFQETLVTNASTAQIDGVELELSVMPLDGWTLRTNVGYLDAKYDEFCSNPNNIYITGPSCGAAGEVDLTGLELRRAPKITGSLDNTNVWRWGPGRMTFNVGVRHKDAYYTTFQNTPLGLTKAARIWDSSLSYDWNEWRLSVYGHNLTNESLRTYALYVAGLWSFANYNLGREYGAQLQYTLD